MTTNAILATEVLETMPNVRAKAGSEESADERYWEAVVGRNPRLDGEFFFAVSTTGVYCRPSCAARRPRRENVAFHETCADAERAGFRPCKRCRPNEPAL